MNFILKLILITNLILVTVYAIEAPSTLNIYPPSNAKVMYGEETISFKWSSVTGAEKYYYTCNTNPSVSAYPEGNETILTSASCPKIDNSGGYYIIVQAFDGNKTSLPKISSSLLIDIDKPEITISQTIEENNNSIISIKSTDISNTNRTIYYTLDGSLPNKYSNIYSHELNLSIGTTINAIAIDDADNISEIATLTIANQNISKNNDSSNLILKNGWNLVGSSLNDVNISITFSMANIVWKYNGDEWLATSENEQLNTQIKSAGYKTFSTVNAGEGFWVHTLNDYNLTVIGTTEENTSLNVNQGWNLLSLKGSLPIEISQFFLDSSISIVWKYDNNEWLAYSNDLESQNKLNQLNIKSIQQINPNEGFWVYSKTDTILSFTMPTNSTENINVTSFSKQSFTNETIVDNDIFLENLYFDANGDNNITYEEDFFVPVLATKDTFVNINAFTTLEVAGLTLDEINQFFSLNLTTTDIDISSLDSEKDLDILKAHLIALILIDDFSKLDTTTSLSRTLTRSLNKSISLDIFAKIKYGFDWLKNEITNNSLNYTTLATNDYTNVSQKSKEKITKVQSSLSYHQATKDILEVDLNEIDVQEFIIDSKFTVEKDKAKIYHKLSPLFFQSRKNYFDYQKDGLEGINSLWQMVGYTESFINGSSKGLAENITKDIVYNTIDGLGVVGVVSETGIKLADKFIDIKKQIVATGNPKLVLTKETIKSIIDIGLVLGNELSISTITEQINSGTMAQYLLMLYYDNDENWEKVNEYLGLTSEINLTQKTFDAVNEKYSLNINGINLGALGITVFENWLVQYNPQSVINIIEKVGGLVEIIYENMEDLPIVPKITSVDLNSNNDELNTIVNFDKQYGSDIEKVSVKVINNTTSKFIENLITNPSQNTTTHTFKYSNSITIFNDSGDYSIEVYVENKDGTKSDVYKDNINLDLSSLDKPTITDISLTEENDYTKVVIKVEYKANNGTEVKEILYKVYDPNNKEIINYTSNLSTPYYKNGWSAITSTNNKNFNIDGEYIIKATATNTNGKVSETYIKSIQIDIANKYPIPDFNWSYNSSTGKVSYTDKSTDDGTICSWLWDWKDGSTSTEQHPIHYYTNSGTYNPTLTATDCEGKSSTATSKDITISLSSDNSVPSVPANVKASDGTYTDKIKITWDSVSDATYYEVYYDTSYNGIYNTLLSTIDNGNTYSNFTTTGSSIGKTYYFKIKACNEYGCSGFSNYDSGYSEEKQEESMCLNTADEGNSTPMKYTIKLDATNGTLQFDYRTFTEKDEYIIEYQDAGTLKTWSSGAVGTNQTVGYELYDTVYLNYSGSDTATIIVRPSKSDTTRWNFKLYNSCIIKSEELGDEYYLGDVFTFNELEYSTVTSPYTGRVWLDRNLGASRVCTSFDDEQCYGDYYQWGRNADGHEKSTSYTTTVKATSIVNAGNKFILGYNWLNSTYTSYNGITQVNNWDNTEGLSICPLGYRVPTIEELEAETVDNNINTVNEVYDSFLKLPASGYRYGNDDYGIHYSGYESYIYSNSSSSGSVKYLQFEDYKAWSFGSWGADGMPVRCIKD